MARQAGEGSGSAGQCVDDQVEREHGDGEAIEAVEAGTDNCPPLPPEAGHTSIYRAVGPEEAADIPSSGFRPNPSGHGYQSGKLFATTLEDAVRFGEINASLGDPFTHIVKITYPTSIEHLIYRDMADGMCYGFVDTDDLPTLNASVDIEVLPWQ